MRPVRGPPQPRSSVLSVQAPPHYPKPLPWKARGPSPGTITSSSPTPGNVRYVDVRVAIPADSPYPTENNIMQYIHPQQVSSPMTVSHSTNSNRDTTWTPPPTAPVFDQGRSRPTSPYAFVPIGPGKGEERGRYTPPISSSPYSFYKSGAASPSMLSVMTEDTTDTASLTVESSSFSRTPRNHVVSPTFSPPLGHNYHHHHHHRASPQLYGRSPKTSNGRKSPAFSKLNNSGAGAGDDDSIRKSRIKTEMCMHYSNGKPCPFGANCTYAHGEEELQMTKLMDLHKAGLVDKDTYRIKPCLTWVATGSW